MKKKVVKRRAHRIYNAIEIISDDGELLKKCKKPLTGKQIKRMSKSDWKVGDLKDDSKYFLTIKNDDGLPGGIELGCVHFKANEI